MPAGSRNFKDRLAAWGQGPLDLERVWWLLPLGLALWMAPYLGGAAGWRFGHVVAMTAALTLGLALRRQAWMRLVLRGLWGLAALAALWAIWQRAGLRGAAGSVVFLASLASLGLICDHLLLKTSAVGRLARTSLFLRLPYLLSLGMLAGVAFFSLAGLAAPISWLFILLPAVCLPWGSWLAWLAWRAWRQRPGPVTRESALPGGAASAALAVLILVPLLLTGIKLATFHKFHYGGHGELYAPMIWSIAHQDNFPVRCPNPAGGPGEIAPSLDNLRFDLNKMCKFLRYYGQPGPDLWPSHFSGETLAAFWHKWAAIHPHDAYRWTQALTSFCLFAWAALMAAPLLGGLSGGALWASVLGVRLNEWCYIDLDLCAMGLLGCLWLLGIFSGQEAGRLGRRGMILFLTVLLGAALYTSYPGTALLMLPLLALALSWQWWRDRATAPGGGTVEGADLLPFLGGALILCLLFVGHGPLGRLIHTLGRQDPVFTAQFWGGEQAKPGQAAPPPQNRLEALQGLAAQSAQAVAGFFTGHTKYLMDYHTFRQIPAFLFLAFLAGALGLLLAAGEGDKPPPAYLLYLALGLLAAYLALQTYNLAIRRDVSLGFWAAPVIVAFYCALYALTRQGGAPGALFWRLAFLALLLGLPVLLIATALHVNRNYFAAYFFQPFLWFSNFLLAFAVVRCLEGRGRLGRGLVILGVLLWLALAMDAWNHFSFWNGLRDIKKISLGLFYRP